MPDLDTLLTTAQAAKRLGLTPGAVRDHAVSGLIHPARRYRRFLLFDADEIDRYARERRAPGRPANITKRKGEVAKLSA